MRKRTFVWLGSLAVVAVAGWLVYGRVAANEAAGAAALQTATVERGTVESSVDAAGSLEAPQSATLSWRVDGVVGAVHVRVGDRVEAGQTLMELDPGSLAPSLLQAQVDLANAQKSLDELLAGPSADVVAQARLAVVQAEDALDDAQDNLDSVLNPDVAYYQQALADAQAALTNAQRESTITDIGGLAGTVSNALKGVEQAERALGEAQAAEDGCGGCDPGRVAKYQEGYAAAVNTLTAAQLQMDLARSQDAAAIAAAQEVVDQAGHNLAAAQAGPNQERLALYRAQLEVAQADLAVIRANLETLEAGPTDLDLAAARARVAAAQATVDQARLAAPFDATVVAVETRAGDLVSPGESGVVLARLDSLEVEVSVSEVDINRIVPGQEVSVTLDAVSGETFRGEVTEVDQMGGVSQGVVNFSVTVVIPDADPAIKPGMTAAVGIVTERRENVLVVPNRAIRVSGGQRSVVVLFEGRQIQVPVTVGLVGNSTSEVVGDDLREGDTVVLNATSAQTGRTPGGLGLGGGFGGDFRP